jgi:hypothetical protein
MFSSFFSLEEKKEKNRFANKAGEWRGVGLNCFRFFALIPTCTLHGLCLGGQIAFGQKVMRYIKMTVRSELSLPKQGPLALPARVHVFFPAVFAHKFRIRLIKKSVADCLKKKRWLSYVEARFSEPVLEW